MRLWVAALLVLFCGTANAVDFPVSWPKSFDDLDIGRDGGLIAVTWQQNSGAHYCLAGNLWNIATADVLGILDFKQSDETTTQYLERIKTKLITRDLSYNETILCQQTIARNRAVWLVEPWRDKPTRNVYEITDAFPSAKNKIGEITVGQPCGSKVADYSATIKVFEWRRVTIPEGEGATVCRKQ